MTQLEQTIAAASHRYTSYLAYLQPFSNTYGNVDLLRGIYEPIAAHPGVIGLAVGTRPDCFAEHVYDYLQDLSARTYVSVELGVQTMHNETLRIINRGHTVQDSKRCIEELDSRGIEIVAHVMLGLPGETRDMIIATAKQLALLPIAGVKIHQLMIIDGTAFKEAYENNQIACLTLEEYAPLLCDFLSYIRPDMHVHRIMANSSVNTGLVAPLWSAHKTDAMNYITAYMDAHATMQGSLWQAGC
jgi:radical SAM protein (TIGR01212 family)